MFYTADDSILYATDNRFFNTTNLYTLVGYKRVQPSSRFNLENFFKQEKS